MQVYQSFPFSMLLRIQEGSFGTTFLFTHDMLDFLLLEKFKGHELIPKNIQFLEFIITKISSQTLGGFIENKFNFLHFVFTLHTAHPCVVYSNFKFSNVEKKF